MQKATYWWVWVKKTFFRLAVAILYQDKKVRKQHLKAWTTAAEKKYLRRYLRVLSDKSELPPARCDDKRIWVCWLQGEDKAPEVVKICLESIRRHCTDYTVTVVCNDNIAQYADIPDYVYEKHRKGYITNTEFSDLLRLSLLSQNGGIWIDATVFLTKALPKEISEADFFAFHARTYLYANSWLLKSERGNVLMSNMRKLMFEYWRCENHMLNYFLYHLFFDLMTETDAESKVLWNKVPVMYDDVCYGLEHNFFTPFDEVLWQKIKEETTIHKLTYKYDKKRDVGGTFLEHFLAGGLSDFQKKNN